MILCYRNNQIINDRSFISITHEVEVENGCEYVKIQFTTLQHVNSKYNYYSQFIYICNFVFVNHICVCL